jgi:hypothetical protein
VLEWAQDAKEPGWWQPFSAAVEADLDLYISLEAEARRIRMYSLPVSGLLQTPAYARMLLTGVAPHVSSEDLERLIEIRIGRQGVIAPDRSGGLPAAARRPAGGQGGRVCVRVGGTAWWAAMSRPISTRISRRLCVSRPVAVRASARQRRASTRCCPAWCGVPELGAGSLTSGDCWSVMIPVCRCGCSI